MQHCARRNEQYKHSESDDWKQDVLIVHTNLLSSWRTEAFSVAWTEALDASAALDTSAVVSRFTLVRLGSLAAMVSTITLLCLL